MRAQDDTTPLIDIRDVAAALGLLTRLPVKVDTDHATARGAGAAWAYPIAGLVVGLIACCVVEVALWFSLPAILTAGLALATLTIVTGAMHEDGLADCTDGFWGGWDTSRRLEIMKDSHIGVYGVSALILGFGLRWAALSALIAANQVWPALIATAMLSRALMVPMMTGLPNARTFGLSQSVGQPRPPTAAIAIGIATLATVVLLQFSGLWIIACAVLATVICAAIAKSKIGGQTGDVLGATQQLTEITCLLALTAILI